MSGSVKKLLHAAAGTAAGGDSIYVEDVFATHLYTGTGSTTQSINNGMDLSGTGGLVWAKSRSSTAGHSLYDTERGVQKGLYSSSTGGNQDDSGGGATAGLYQFNSNGFSLGDNYGVAANSNNADMVAWTFLKQEGFFDIVSYTGNGSTDRRIAHNLGCNPGLLVVKRTDASGDWWTQHGTSNDHYYKLNSTDAQTSDGSFWSTTSFNSTEFGVGGTSNTNNINGASYIAYLWAHGNDSASQIFGDDSDEAIIKTGSFTPTGSGTAKQTINLGFEPQWLLLKNATSTQSGNWWIFDNMRGFTAGDGSGSAYLFADTSAAESAFGAGSINITNQGFEMVNNAFVSSSQTFIYMAIRRGPMKEPSAGTDVYIADESHASAYENPMFQGTFPVDMSIFFEETSTDGPYFGSRLTGKGAMEIDQTLALYNENNHVWDYMNGWYNRGSGSDANNIAHMFRRYPKVFDVVAYTGAGAGTHTHNLKAVPEMMIIKNTSHSNRWIVYHSALGNNQQVHLDENITPTTGQFNDTTPTASVFSVSNNTQSGTSGRTYVALLFASLSGISKVGTYTGTGSDLNVTDLGAPVRYLLVKRTDSTSGLSGGHWAVFDSTVQGINSGYDPFPYLSQHDAMTTNIDIVDQHSSGFSVNGNTDHDFNVNGATYIYLAIA